MFRPTLFDVFLKWSEIKRSTVVLSAVIRAALLSSSFGCRCFGGVSVLQLHTSVLSIRVSPKTQASEVKILLKSENELNAQNTDSEIRVMVIRRELSAVRRELCLSSLKSFQKVLLRVSHSPD